MNVLDTTFLIDYLAGEDAATGFLEARPMEHFVIPAPALAEVLVGEGNGPDQSDVQGVRDAFDWAEVYAVDAETAATAGAIADEIEPEGPYLAGIDGLIAAVGRELDAPVVTDDGDLTHPETERVIDVEAYATDD